MVNRENLARIIEKTWGIALKDLQGGEPENTAINKKASNAIEGTNRQRSESWICALGKAFENVHDANSHRVFWRGYAGDNGNKEEFLLTEFLFDVTVAEIGYVDSLERYSRKLPFVRKCKWAVESEFDTENSRQIWLDLSKLVVASAENKLLVVSHRSMPETESRIRERCAEMVRVSGGNYFLAFVAHPSTWGDVGKVPPTVFELDKNKWVQLDSK